MKQVKNTQQKKGSQKISRNLDKDSTFIRINEDKKILDKIRRTNSNFFNEIPNLKKNLKSPNDDVNITRKMLNNQIDKEIEMSFLEPKTFIEKIKYIENASTIFDNSIVSMVNDFKFKKTKEIDALLREIEILQDELVTFSLGISELKLKEKKIKKEAFELEQEKQEKQKFKKSNIIGSQGKDYDAKKFAEDQKKAKQKFHDEIMKRELEKKQKKAEAKERAKDMRNKIKQEFKDAKQEFKEEYKRSKEKK